MTWFPNNSMTKLVVEQAIKRNNKTAADYAKAARTAVTGTSYHVIHKASGTVKSICSTRQRARNKLHKLDNEYGGYAHQVITVVVNHG